MFRLETFFFFLIVIFLIIGCSNTSQKVDYTYLSTEYCRCTQRTIELNQQMRQLFEANKNEEIGQLVVEVDKAFKTSLACCTQAKNGLTKSTLDKEKLEKALRKECIEMPIRLMEDLLAKIN